MSDLLPFLRAWVADPRRVAAISPSGPALTELMTREVTPENGPVLELGPGTGVFTRGLLARGLDQHDLTLIEAGKDFAQTLANRFPQARVVCMDATRLGRANLYPEQNLGTVISGLPLLSMNPRQVMGVLGGAFRYLRQGGHFYQFTYSPRCPVHASILDRLGLKAARVGHTIRNVPPSSVYRFSRLEDDETWFG
ncbi:class I SAM-dependent methyltransferase [Thalassospira profundimaris]|uniref:class I SAM-dependent methyltransferase n=1 Tax=Thalassospira profundimaris TaxID=502049 RepID=UPI000DEDC226|nr:methyltransferase domain-containing protein [Thalassospira profundimaris]